MLKPKKFIAITTQTLNNQLAYIATSCGKSLFNENGITFDKAIEFLFELIHEKDSGFTTVFVNYAFARDNEFIFATMPRDFKDRLFQSENIQKRVTELELENEDLEGRLYDGSNQNDKVEAALFQSVNRMVLKGLVEVEYNDYFIRLINGKMLTVRHGGKAITFYDVYGFFNKPLRESVRLWLNEDLMLLDRKELEKLDLPIRDKITLLSFLEVTATAKLAEKLDCELGKLGYNLTRFHGASSLSSKFLSQLKAKDEYHNYRFRRQHPPELWKAVRQSCYGGRQEQFKIGTLKNVYVYDINSAYAHAIAHLPSLQRKPTFTETWTDCPFSIWFCDYDFTDVDPYFGLLPNRDVGNATKYKLKGKGYFWQPEIEFVKKHYPGSVKINGGFIIDYQQADFAKGIETLYQLRLELQRQNNPLEKIIKLALASLYGKFCQRQGRAFYYNLFYAGFITSFTRARLLEVTQGKEKNVITFQTDAVHTDKPLGISTNNNLGEYRQTVYNSVTYLDNGVYRALDSFGNIIKEKTRGIRSFEFEKALQQIKQQQTYTALIDFFVGHNLHTNEMFKGAPYLSQYAIDKTFSPIAKERSAMRLFEVLDIDLSKSYFNSRPLNTFSGLESGVYRQNDNVMLDAAKQTIQAGRV